MKTSAIAAAILALTIPGVTAAQPPESNCWSEGSAGPFRGSSWTREIAGRTVIFEQIGTRGSTAVIQKTFGDLHLCLVADAVGVRDGDALPSRWVDTAPRFVLESQRGTAVRELTGLRDRTGTKLAWRVDGRSRPFDGATEEWRDRLLDLLDTTWEISVLQGQVSSLRGEISSVRGQQSSLRGEISSLRGHVSSLRGRISSIRGEESSLRGRISSIRGRRAHDADERIAAVEREIAALNAPRRVAQVEEEIRAFDVEGKVADVERRIKELDVEGKVGAIERQIAALDADRRVAALKARRDQELKRFEELLSSK